MKKSTIQVLQATVSGALGGVAAVVEQDKSHENPTAVNVAADSGNSEESQELTVVDVSSGCFDESIVESVLTPIDEIGVECHEVKMENPETIGTLQTEGCYELPDSEYGEVQKGAAEDTAECEMPDYVNDADINAYI